MTLDATIAEIGTERLPGACAVPADAAGLVVFAHGSGSSRLSPRNVAVADRLVAAGFGTLLFDLLTEPESRNRDCVFDIPLLTERLVEAIDWVRAEPSTSRLPIGLFGASTGAAAALLAAVERPAAVRAVVSRGGRPDLAGPAIVRVRAPTLFLVGGRDEAVLTINRNAQNELSCESALVVVPGATHLFAEPGALETVVREAIGWFRSHLSGRLR